MISIMVPALNEEKHISNVTKMISDVSIKLDIKIEIIIVNDGSTDNTGNIAENLKSIYSYVSVIHNSTNLGGGDSLRKVIKIATGEKLLIVAGDGDMLAEDLEFMLVNAHKADMVFLYFVNKELRGRFRNILSTLYNTIFVLFFKIYVQYINGPCVLPLDKLKETPLFSKRFSIISEIAVKLLHSGCSYHEIPGYMQQGVDGSSAVSLRNLMEVFVSFIKLVIEIKITSRSKYNKVPHRIY
jgi:glycosyltransferase involved in cell wall biosynthesis